MIVRKNIVDLLGDRIGVYHSAVLTCFSFDPIFFESIYLPVLRNLGINNIVVLMESTIYDQLLADSAYVSHRVDTCNYTLVRQANHHSGVFHTKLTLLFGTKEAAMVLGSGNLTFSGMSLNDEVWNVFHMKNEESGHFGMVRKAWEYVKVVARDCSPLTKRQLQWMQEHTKWLLDDYVDGPIVLKESETAWMLFNSTESTIIEQLYEVVGDAQIVDITVVSPFFDSDGRFLKELEQHFAPARFRCVLDKRRQSAPYALFKADSAIEFYSYKNNTPPLHAKIVELHSDSDTWVLSGSANAGNIAFGTTHHVWNDEACILLKREGQLDYFGELGLNEQVEKISLEEYGDYREPKRKPEEPSTVRVAISSCELREDGLHVAFSKSDVAGKLSLLNEQMSIIGSFDVVSSPDLVLDIKDLIHEERKLQMVVLCDDVTEISNRCLVIRENDVERGNPDPKRRKLTLVLNDPDLSTRLEHLIDFIEFDDKLYMKKGVSAGASVKVAPGAEVDDIVVGKEDFFNYKNVSSKQINEHSGIRILETLKNLLYVRKDDAESQESLEQYSAKDDGDTNEPHADAQPAAPDENEMPPLTDEQRRELQFKDTLRNTLSYLNRLEAFLKAACKDNSVMAAGSLSMGNLPKLVAEPGLNACTSLNAALLMVNILMSGYKDLMSTADMKKVRTLVYNCASLFYALYGFCLPTDDSFYGEKIRYLFRQNAMYLLVDLSYFHIGLHDFRYQLPQLILNCLSVWDNMPEQLNLALDEYRMEKDRQSVENVVEQTLERIDEIISNYRALGVPTHTFTKYDHLNPIYISRKGYGFMITTVKGSSGGWDLTYRHPRFGSLIVELKGVTKYLGFKDEEI